MTHRESVEWRTHRGGYRPLRSWRLTCGCGFEGGWVSQQKGTAAASKAAVAALDAHKGDAGT